MKERGFTFIETVIVMGMFSMLFGFVVVNMTSVQKKTSLNSLVNTLVSDINYQQIKAMTGFAESPPPNKFGIHFSQGNYTLFKGDSYSETDPANFVVPLESTVKFSNINLPDSSIVFNQGNGEVTSFDPLKNQITLSVTEGESKTLSINKYGSLSE